MKFLFVVVCVFVVCWIFYIIVNLLNGFGIIQLILCILDVISIFLIFFFSFCNLFIYGFMNKKFCKGFCVVFCVFCQKCVKIKEMKFEWKISGEIIRNLSLRLRSSYKREWKIVIEICSIIYEICVQKMYVDIYRELVRNII